MKNFRDCIIIMTIFFLAALAFLEVDRRCSGMYNREGRLEAAVVSAVTMVSEN